MPPCEDPPDQVKALSALLGVSCQAWGMAAGGVPGPGSPARDPEGGRHASGAGSPGAQSRLATVGGVPGRGTAVGPAFCCQSGCGGRSSYSEQPKLLGVASTMG